VVATGGSVVYSDEAMAFLAAAGPVVYLALPLEQLQQRLTNLATRGVVMPAGQTLADLHRRRAPLYQRWADVTIDCAGKSHQQALDAIVAALGDGRE
jgi:shikimate kinase